MPPSVQSPKPARGAKPGARSPYTARLARLLRGVNDAGCSHLLVTNPLDVAYLTGFLGGDSYLLVGPPRAVMISDARFQQELVELRGPWDVHIRKNRTMSDAVAVLAAERGVRALALQGDHLTLSGKAQLAARAKGLKLVDTAALVANLRQIKDAGEVALIRAANALGEKALKITLLELDALLRKKGKCTERHAAAILEMHMKALGSSAPSFETIMASGPSAALPHYRPGTGVIKPGRALLIDWGATHRGYHGDMTRVVCWGRWPKVIAEIYRIALDAHALAAAELAPGRTGQEIDAIARGHIARAGLGERFGHSLGHGLGLNVHEGPRLAQMAPGDVLRPGHVVTVEPGIYLPGVGGVRIEDNYLITDKGCERLCSLPKSMDWATR